MFVFNWQAAANRLANATIRAKEQDECAFLAKLRCETVARAPQIEDDVAVCVCCYALTCDTDLAQLHRNSFVRGDYIPASTKDIYTSITFKVASLYNKIDIVVSLSFPKIVHDWYGYPYIDALIEGLNINLNLRFYF